MKKAVLSSVLIVLCILADAQSANTATGGNATGTGGSVSYSVGQIVYTTNTGTNGSVAHGVQQPYEISVVTAIENTEGITLEYKVYPNPTRVLVTLTVKPFNNENLRFRLYDINGILLQDKMIEGAETEISMENLSSAVYFLKVLKDNKEIKIFKIVKR